jgi:hypothetical protein
LTVDLTWRDKTLFFYEKREVKLKMDFLKEFIKQTQTGSLKTKDYPKEYLDLKMKVSLERAFNLVYDWVLHT